MAAKGFRIKTPGGTDATIKLSRRGIPIEAQDWTLEDWSDLNKAVEESIAKISARRKQCRGDDLKGEP